VNARATLEEDLRQRRHQRTGQFLLYYQPLVARALDWRRGPDPLAASNTRPGVARRVHSAGRGDGLDSALGDWVLKAACEQLAPGWPQAIRHLSLAVNISACSSASRASSLRYCRPWSAPAQTESTQAGTYREHAGREYRGGHRQNDRTQGVGLSFSLDDFGTGYSVAGLPEAPASRSTEDRPGFCARYAGGCDQRRHCANHHFAGPRGWDCR